MRTKAKLVAALAATVLIVAACNNDDPAATPGPDETEPPMTAATLQVVDDAELGDILADSAGRTVYVFLNDEPGVSNCADTCAVTWPPVDPEGDPSAGEGVDEALLDTITRDDGTNQVTYNDWPVYLYSGDVSPGDTNGQGFGDNWFVVSPDGEPVQE